MRLDPTTSLKTCSRCGEAKAADQFHRDATKVDGLALACKQCRCKGPRERAQFHELGKRKGYYQRHRERLLEQRREQYRQNPEAAKARAARWRQDNPERALGIARANTHRKRSSEGSFTPAEWDVLCQRYANRCLACGATGVKLTVDHVIPISKGGASWISNIQPLCRPCNRKKNDQIIDYRPKE